jgi:aminodeoxyfutalosine deaminase
MPAGEIIRAASVAPMSAPLIRDGAIAFADGHILAVGKSAQIKTQFRDFSVRDLGHAIILPGLVNAHTHLELSDCISGPKATGQFIDWIRNLASINPCALAQPASGTSRNIPHIPDPFSLILRYAA